MPDVSGSPLFASSPSVEYKGAAHKYDSARNVFLVTSEFMKANNNDTWLTLRKLNSSGALLGSWRLLCTGYKTAGNPAIENDGTTVIVTNAVYQVGIPAETRTSYAMRWDIPSVFEVGGTTPPPPTGTNMVITSGPVGVIGTWQKIG